MEGGSGCYYSGGGGGGGNNWDLHAVVSFACGGGRVPPPPSSDDPFSSFLPPKEQPVTDDELPNEAWQPLPDLPGCADPAVVDDLFKAFFAPSSPPPPQLQQQPAVEPRNEGTTDQLQPAADAPPAVPQATVREASCGGGPRSKRKKKQVKKVVQRVPADFASADPWAWRKYGQKPIKGSPYPRGYYRCSSDKECKARKLVERCRTDPDTFIVTYTGGDHSHPVPIHRNSLAGTTRHKQVPSPEPAAVAASTEAAAEPSPAPSTSAGMSPTTPLRSPSVEYGQEEGFDEAGASLLAEDVEMIGEDVLLFLNPDETATDVGGDSKVDGGAGTAPVINVVEETFVVTPWITAAGDAVFTADGGWR